MVMGALALYLSVECAKKFNLACLYDTEVSLVIVIHFLFV